MHDLSQNYTAQSIKDSSTIYPRDDFEARLYSLTAELEGVRN